MFWKTFANRYWLFVKTLCKWDMYVPLVTRGLKARLEPITRPL